MSEVLITGVGTVTCIGTTRDEFQDALLNGRCGLDQLQVHDTTDLSVTIGGEIREIDVDRVNVGEKVSARKMDRASQFAVWAAHQAVEDAGITPGKHPHRCAVVLGAGLSGMATLQAQTEKLISRGPRRVSPFTIPMLMPNAAPANVGLSMGITGPCYTVSSACSSSGHAMIDAFEMLRRNDVDVVITGGTESSLTRLGIAAFVNMGAMSAEYNDRPQQAVRPFAADRAGLIMSEGAGILVFESASSARRRGRTHAYARVLGYGSTTDSYHMVAPDPEATQAALAIERAVQSTGLTPANLAALTYVNAHGTATEYNDVMETRALKSVFAEAAYELQISSTKGTTGHMIGGACSTEMIAAALALRDGILPPTINCENPDPDCDLDYIRGTARESAVQYALNNSFGFGGHNVCLALSRWAAD